MPNLRNTGGSRRDRKTLIAHRSDLHARKTNAAVMGSDSMSGVCHVQMLAEFKSDYVLKLDLIHLLYICKKKQMVLLKDAS